MRIVIGSGPASVFCALALLKRGERVTMLDAGITLEDNRSKAIDTAANQSKNEWSSSLLSMLREKTDPSVGGLPKKLIYGSDYPFRSADPSLKIEQRSCETLTSHALGGLSNVWGANILPLLSSETSDWPVTTERLWPFYKEISRYIPVSSDNDDLTELLGDCFTSFGVLSKSRQSLSLLSTLRGQREQLKQAGIYFGSSRLAVNASKCEACGLCLYGCPHRLIYSSADSIELLRSFEGFSYRPGFVVQAVRESDSGAQILARAIDSNSNEEFLCERVYVGCGPVNSTALLLASFGRTGEEVRLKDSQYFMSPFLRFRGAPSVTKEALHTLSQVTAEIINKNVCERSIHLLFYSYNDMYLRAIEKLCGRFAGFMRPAIDFMLGHMMVVQGYLHSDYSGALGVSWKAPNHLMLTGYKNNDTQKYIRKTLRTLWKNARAFNGVPITPMNHTAPVGKSYHLGSSFPMSQSPEGWQSDTFGRVKGLRRVHVVDASVLPAIPAQNTTLTVMANAYRIGAES